MHHCHCIGSSEIFHFWDDSRGCIRTLSVSTDMGVTTSHRREENMCTCFPAEIYLIIWWSCVSTKLNVPPYVRMPSIGKFNTYVFYLRKITSRICNNFQGALGLRPTGKKVYYETKRTNMLIETDRHNIFYYNKFVSTDTGATNKVTKYRYQPTDTGMTTKVTQNNIGINWYRCDNKSRNMVSNDTDNA